MHSRKGQAAVEFVVTYGWAFILILISLGALSYFGVFSPETYLPESCDFPQEFQCVDYSVVQAPGAGQVKIDLINNFGRDISVSNSQIYTYSFGADTACTPDVPTTIPANQRFTLTCNLGNSLPSGKIKIFANFTYNRPGSLRTHLMKGELFAKAVS